MAVSSPLNPPSAGGLAGRPTRQVGGVRRQNETPLTFQNRMGGQPAGVTPPPMQTREDRILASRMDGTFDAKRSAFNAQAKNQFMDEAGNIAATSQNFGAGAAAPAPSPQFASAPDGRGGSKMVQIPATPPMVGPPTPQAINKKTIANRMAAGRAKAEAERPGAVNAMTPPAQTPKVTPPVYAPGSLEARAQALGNAMQINNSRQTAATVAKASQSSQDMAMAQGAKTFNLLTQGKPLQSPTPPPLTPAEQLAESVRPGSVAAHRAVTPPSNPPPQNVTPEQQYKQDYMAAVQTGRTPMGKLQMRNAAGDYGDNADQRGRSNGLRIVGPPGNQQTTILEHDLAHLDQLNAQNPPPGKRVLAQTGKPLPPIPPQPGIIRDPIAARADGGPVQAGKPYLVGERGPEIIVPKQSGTVIPNHQLPAKVTAPNFKYKQSAINMSLMAARG